MLNIPELFVGITSWNSGTFLGHCIRSVLKTTAAIAKRIVVLDNASTDDSVKIAKACGAEVVISQCAQADAVNKLFRMSRSEYTLLIHSDVILLSARWFGLCKGKIGDDIILVSPEDIGCGPYTRPFGIQKPESSFLFFDTLQMRKAVITRFRHKFGLPIPERVIDFYGNHVTHNIPFCLAEKGFAWLPMNVHVSDHVEEPIFQPSFIPQVWSDELAHLRYGLGNFYSIDGVITHYHNWYDRVSIKVTSESDATTEKDGGGFPAAYIKAYTEAFLKDYDEGHLILPSAEPVDRKPAAL